MCYEPQRAWTVMSLWSFFCTDFAGPGATSVFLASLTLCCVHYSVCLSLITSLTTLPVIAYRIINLMCSFLPLWHYFEISLEASKTLDCIFAYQHNQNYLNNDRFCHSRNCPPFPMWLSIS